MAASWRQRNLRSRWCVRQYKTTTWECRGQHPRHQPMNWCDSIRVSDNRHTQGHSQSVLAYAALSKPMKENSIRSYSDWNRSAHDFTVRWFYFIKKVWCCFGSLDINSFPEVKQVVNWGRCWNPINQSEKFSWSRQKKEKLQRQINNHSGKIR